MVSLACMTLLGGHCLGGEPLQASSLGSPEAESLRIVEGSTVTLQYVTTDRGSTGIDYGIVSEFIQGRHEIFPALEREIVGMKPGDEKTIELSPAEGFGPHDDKKMMNIPKPLLPPGAKRGDVLRKRDVLRNGVCELVTVAEVGDLMAMLDYNHPLAGKSIVVQLKILKVENP